MNTVAIILSFAAIALVHCSTAKQIHPCPMFRCLENCKFGQRISEESGCPTCGCKTEEDATECQLAAADGLENPIPGKAVYQCDQFGEYSAQQCKDNYCACVDKSGKNFTQWLQGEEGLNLKCDCAREARDARHGGRRAPIGAFVPRCETNGQYKSVQCHGSTGYCWCAHPETGRQLGQQVRGRPNCEEFEN